MCRRGIDVLHAVVVHTLDNVRGVIVIELVAVKLSIFVNRSAFKSRKRNAGLEHRTAGKFSVKRAVEHGRIFIVCKARIIIAVQAVFVQIVGRVTRRREHGKILDRQHNGSACGAVLSVAFFGVYLRFRFSLSLCRLNVFRKAFRRGFLKLAVEREPNITSPFRRLY